MYLELRRGNRKGAGRQIYLRQVVIQLCLNEETMIAITMKTKHSAKCTIATNN